MHETLWRERQSRRRRALIATTAFALALFIFLPGVAADISYVYDDAGRLCAVIDPASDTAVYSYDAVGNLTGITRQPSSTLAVLQFTPSSSPIGSTVMIYGTGFSATPVSNTVKFNGTTATVLTASTTVLTANVPNGATTGPISVTVGSKHRDQFGVIYRRHRRNADTLKLQSRRRELWRNGGTHRHEL